MARVDVGALARGVERTGPFGRFGTDAVICGSRAKKPAPATKARPSAGTEAKHAITVPEYVLAILRLAGWAAYVRRCVLALPAWPRNELGLTAQWKEAWPHVPSQWVA